ncbi:hypothetical protein EGW08_010474 [Elysia chlorotica]|uniref:Uncharacterized protein n=1 Tax=Elysia chlorotica TaxID=188477 RepID=A0A3S0ZSN5_ELYCH|nr:hypothetical protein EGW08_010474 [Elysia chlorotica]
MIIAVLLHGAGNLFIKAFPSMRARANEHNKAAAKWQKMQEKMKTLRWCLEDPTVEISKIHEWYEKLIVEREETCNIANIPQKKYEKAGTLELVKKRIKERRDLYLGVRGVYE